MNLLVCHAHFCPPAENCGKRLAKYCPHCQFLSHCTHVCNGGKKFDYKLHSGALRVAWVIREPAVRYIPASKMEDKSHDDLIAQACLYLSTKTFQRMEQ